MDGGVVEWLLGAVGEAVRNTSRDEDHLAGSGLECCLTQSVGAPASVDDEDFFVVVAVKRGDLPWGRGAKPGLFRSR